MMRKMLGGACAALLLAACGGSKQQTGSATVSVRAAGEALTLSSVSLTIRKDGAAGAVEFADRPLVGGAAGTFTGLFESLPAGVHSFCAVATADDRTFGPTCVDATVRKNKVASVSIVIQQASAPGTVNSDSPLIAGISVSEVAPHYGEPVTMSVTAVDAGRPLTYLWTAVCSAGPAGNRAFADTDKATAVLTSDCHGTETITIAVTDAERNISSAVSFPLAYSAQGASVSATVNAWPDITGITTSDAQVAPGASTAVHAAASDVDGDALGYSWTAVGAGCGSVAGSGADVTFTSDAAKVGDCTLTVKVTDGRGGSNEGSIVLHVGAVWDSQPWVVQCNADFSSCPEVAGSLGASASRSGEFVTLTKSDPAAAAGLSILGESQPLASLAFDVTGYCNNGSPRFNVFYEGTPVYSFFGCAYGAHDGSTVRFVPADASNSDGSTGLPAGAGKIKRISIVMDEVGSSTLSNIRVNGGIVPLKDFPLSLAPYIDVCDSSTWICNPVSSYADAASYVDATGLHLKKLAADGGGAAFGPNARILGVGGLTLSTVSFQAVGTIGAGSPRLYVRTLQAPPCALDAPVVVGSLFTFAPTATCGAGTLTGLDIIADMGGLVGSVDITDVKVNGRQVIP